jgi:hypothetical protein
LVIPPTTTLFGELQYIFFATIFYKANIIPNVILTGRPGGTVIVMRSKNFKTRVPASVYFDNLTIKII